MGKMTIEQLLNGKTLNRQTITELQRNVRVTPSGSIAPGQENEDYYHAVKSAAEELSRREKLENASVLKKNSVALNIAGDEEITFDNVVRWKMDPRYSSTDPCTRDPVYVKAVEIACAELGAARQAQIDSQGNE
jgi:hypothetical protein